jgi:glycosyltransferase involved in cell wall biosynthesis
VTDGPDRPARRLLLVSYYSPPWGGPQGFRIAQLVRNLPAAGWEPQLLTVRASAYGEGALSDDTSYLETRRGAIETRMLTGEKLIGALRRGGGNEEEAPTVGETPARYSLKTRAAALLATPDRLVPWVPFATAAGLRAARKADLIYAAGPPFTNHLPGLALSRLARKPLVVSVNDPWVSMDHRIWYSERQRRLHARLERGILTRADATLTCTEGFGQDLIDRIGADNLRGPVVPIHWGYDPAEVVGLQGPAEAPPVRLVYAGSLRGAQYDPSGLFAALGEMARRDPALGERIQLDVYGEPEPAYRALGEAEELRGVVNFKGYRPHEEVTAACAAAHACVLIVGDEGGRELPWYLSAKVYLYAGVRRPILALVPQGGDAQRLVEARSLGIATGPSDVPGIVAAIERIEREHADLAEGIGQTEDLSTPVAALRAGQLFDDVVEGRAPSLDRTKAKFE